MAQTISDGRSANAPDRTAHSSLSWGDPNGEAALYGMTNKSAETLLALAKSWNRPPGVTLLNDAYGGMGYDYTQRAYVFRPDKGGDLQVTFNANPDSPLDNLAILIEEWDGGTPDLKLDGEIIPEGKAYRTGIEYDVEGNQTLIVFLKVKVAESTKVELIKAG